MYPLAPPGAVARIVAVPFATAVTTPVSESTRTFVVSLLVHAKVTPGTTPSIPAQVASAVSCRVAPSAVSVVPEGPTVTVAARRPRSNVPPSPTAKTVWLGRPNTACRLAVVPLVIRNQVLPS